MKTRLKTVLAATAICATPALAHVGPDAVDHHFAEHLVMAFALGLPVLFGLLHLLKRNGNPRR